MIDIIKLYTQASISDSGRLTCGRVCEFGGLEWWNGTVEWTTGLDYWSATPTNIQLAWSVVARSKLVRLVRR